MIIKTSQQAANRMEMSAQEREKIDAERRNRQTETVVRNDDLLGTVHFRRFLADIATRAGYFATGSTASEYMRGYRDAMRDIVNGIVTTSTKGAAFLAEYAQAVTAARGIDNRLPTNGENEE